MDKVTFNSVPSDEQETTINIFPSEKKAFVYSSVPHIAKRLLGYVRDYPDECAIEIHDEYGAAIVMPVEWISFKPKKKRVMSEEQKAAAAERFRKYREEKQ